MLQGFWFAETCDSSWSVACWLLFVWDLHFSVDYPQLCKHMQVHPTQSNNTLKYGREDEKVAKWIFIQEETDWAEKQRRVIKMEDGMSAEGGKGREKHKQIRFRASGRSATKNLRPKSPELKSLCEIDLTRLWATTQFSPLQPDTVPFRQILKHQTAWKCLDSNKWAHSYSD